jgi:hypothetical protein
MGAVAGLFLVVLLGTGAAELAMPPKALKLVGQERRDAAESEEQQAFWDGSLARSKEANFRLHGRVRRWLAPYWSAAMLGLRDVPNDDVIVGDEGWLFLRDRVQLPTHSSAAGGRHLANLMGLVGRSLHSRGTQLICVPIPRKSVTCADKLPTGIDCDPSFDAAVIEALCARGVTTINIAPAWNEHPAGDIYLKHDSHWAWGGRRLLAEELGREVPELDQGNAEYTLVEGPEHVASDGLRFAGIDRGHPANRFFNATADPALALLPSGSEERIDSRELGSDVLLAGTSFCELFQFRAHLCDVLQTPVEDASELGRMPLLSLERALITRPLEDFPAYVITEFPMHHAANIERGSTPTVRAALGMARQLGFADRAGAVPDELFHREPTGTPALRAPMVSFPPGSLLSSGDGVLGIQFEFDGTRDSKWTYSTGGAEIVIGAKKGSRVRALPVVEEGQNTGFYASLTPKTPASVGTSVRAIVVTDADLENGFEFTGEKGEDGDWSADLDRSVSEQDSLALTWGEWTTGRVEVTAEGQDRHGRAIDATWSFEDARRARFAIVTLGRFYGGRITGVQAVGTRGPVKGVVAGQVRSL